MLVERDSSHEVHLKLNLVRGFTRDSIRKWAQAGLDPAARVISDDLSCFSAVVDAGCQHQPIVVGALKPRDLPRFKWVNTVLGNLKTTLTSAFHSLNYRKYAQRYLSAFTYRFNRRFDLRGLVAHLIVDVVQDKPAKKSMIRAHAEAGFQSCNIVLLILATNKYYLDTLNKINSSRRLIRTNHHN